MGIKTKFKEIIQAAKLGIQVYRTQRQSDKQARLQKKKDAQTKLDDIKKLIDDLQTADISTKSIPELKSLADRLKDETVKKYLSSRTSKEKLFSNIATVATASVLTTIALTFLAIIPLAAGVAAGIAATLTLIGSLSTILNIEDIRRDLIKNTKHKVQGRLDSLVQPQKEPETSQKKMDITATKQAFNETGTAPKPEAEKTSAAKPIEPPKPAG